MGTYVPMGLSHLHTTLLKSIHPYEHKEHRGACHLPQCKLLPLRL